MLDEQVTQYGEYGDLDYTRSDLEILDSSCDSVQNIAPPKSGNRRTEGMSEGMYDKVRSPNNFSSYVSYQYLDLEKRTIISSDFFYFGIEIKKYQSNL